MCDDTWVGLIHEVVNRYGKYILMHIMCTSTTPFVYVLICYADILPMHRVPGAHNQHFILNFMTSIGATYTMDSRSADFILDLLAVKVPKLFAVSDVGCALGVAVQKEFSMYLHSYIQTNGLKRDMMKSIDKILVH